MQQGCLSLLPRLGKKMYAQSMQWECNESSSKAENVGEAGEKESVQLSICQGWWCLWMEYISGFWEGSAFPGMLDTSLKVKWRHDLEDRLLSSASGQSLHHRPGKFGCCCWKLSGEGQCSDIIRGRQWAALYTFKSAASRHVLLPQMLSSKVFFRLIMRPLSTQPQSDKDDPNKMQLSLVLFCGRQIVCVLRTCLGSFSH